MSSDLIDEPAGSGGQDAETAVAETPNGLGADNQNQPPLVDLLVGEPLGRPIFEADASLHHSEGQDTLDLADLLNGQAGSDNIDDFLLAINHGSSSTLLVDTDGTRNFTNPDLVLEIGGVDWDSSTAGQLADLVSDAVILVV